MEEDHLFGLKLLFYMNWKTENIPIRYFSVVFLFVCSYGSTIQHPPGINKNIWDIRLILKPSLEHRVLWVCSRWRLDNKDPFVGLRGRDNS